MKNRTKDIIKLLILSICMIVEFIYFLVAAITILFYDELNLVPELTLGCIIIVAILTVLLMCISFSGILTIKKGNKTMLFSDLLMKIVLIWIAAGFTSIAIAENMYVSVFMIISGIIVSVLMTINKYCNVKRKGVKNKVIRATYSGRVIKKDDNYIDINKTQFEDDKAKLDWYSNAEVYEIRKFGKDVMNLCLIIGVISSLILIPVLIFNIISDVAAVIFVMGILFVVCIYGIVSGYQQHKYPEKYTIETRSIYGSNWNMKYLERLPKEDNTYKIKLNADEKVVFTAIMQRLLTGSGECLGESVKFIITNQRIIADYDANVLKINISKDLLDYRKEKNRKNVYFKVLVDEVITSEKKTKKSAIYIFEFNNEDTIKFEEILYNISIHNNNYDSTIIYKNKGYSWGEACENYCKQFNRKKEELSEAEEDIIWDYSYSDINYLLMWIIENNFYVYTEEVFYDKNEWLKFIKEIKDRKAVPTDFMLQTEGYLDKEEISKDIWNFIDVYYLNDKSSDGNQVVSEENDIGLYEVHLDNFARNILKKEVYGFGFKWEEYDKFKIVIDNAYKKFKNIQQNKV